MSSQFEFEKDGISFKKYQVWTAAIDLLAMLTPAHLSSLLFSTSYEYILQGEIQSFRPT